MPRIDIGELTLNVEERGAGPAFIFIPGLVGLLNAWEFQMAEFSKRYRCISFDHRGAGDSDKPQDGYTTELIARDVIALMDKLGIDKAHVAGTSTGGCVLQNLAIDHPERLRCCIFSNTWVKADEYITRVQTDAQAHRALLRAGGVRQGLLAVHQRCRCSSATISTR